MVLELARPSVPWCFAVSESPVELRCGAVLKAWELHFGAGLAVAAAAVSPAAAVAVRAAAAVQQLAAS